MKEINFRIIELPTHQILISKDFDEEEEERELLVITFFIEGLKFLKNLVMIMKQNAMKCLIK